MKSSDCTTVLEVKESIHDTVVNSCDSVITLNDILMKSSKYTTLLEVKKNIHDTVVNSFDSVITLTDILKKRKTFMTQQQWCHDSQCQNPPYMTV